MKFTLPTQHVLYFGIQAKRGKLNATGATKAANVNVAEIYNQVTMMLGHEIFDPEIGKRVLVDHAFIVAGGEITKSEINLPEGALRHVGEFSIEVQLHTDLTQAITVVVEAE